MQGTQGCVGFIPSIHGKRPLLEGSTPGSGVTSSNEHSGHCRAKPSPVTKGLLDGACSRRDINGKW